MKFGLALLGLIGLAYVGCQAAYPAHSFRYRLTLSVEADGKVHTGSSVVEVTEKKQPKIGDAPSSVMSIRGEAVVVDLGPRGLLFALLKGVDYGSEAGNIVYKTFPPPTPHGSGAAMPENLKRYARSSEKADLPASRIPLLVRFRDINDPKSVERVDPNNLAKSFGSGIRLVRATLELTRDPVTSGLNKALLWLRGMVTNIDGTSVTTSNNEANRLNAFDFVRGAGVQ